MATVLELQHQSFQWIFRIDFLYDWFGLFAVQGALKSLIQQHSLKASILQCSVFFILQLSHPYMTIGKTIALTIWTSVGKLMSLLFNMLSRLVIWIRQWLPTPVLLPGKSHGWRNLVGYCPWGCKESDTTERLHFTSLLFGKCPVKSSYFFSSYKFYMKNYKNQRNIL